MIVFSKGFYIPLILCVLNKNNFVFSMNWTEESKVMDLDGKENTVCPEEFQNFCDKKSVGLDNLLRVFFMSRYNTDALKNKRIPVSSSPSFTNPSCTCGMNFRMMDLGNNYYPRYFHTGVCKKSSCGVFHRCHPKKYRVQILRRKDDGIEAMTDLPESHESTFPVSLQENWAADYVNIVVGCDCLPKKI